MDAYTVSFHGWPQKADAAARSMLRLLLPMLGNRWSIADSNHCNVVILEAAALAALRATGAARSGTLYIVFAADPSPPPGAFATVQRPLNSSRLIELLHLAQDELDIRGAPPDKTTIAAIPGDSAGTQQAERTVRTTMRAALSWTLKDRSRAVTVRDLNQATILSVLPELGFTTRLRSNRLADLIRTNASVDLVELNETEEASLRNRSRFDPLTKLEWIYWLAGSDGRIRPGLMVSRLYQLRKYPDFAVLPHYHGDVRMASLLKAAPLTVSDLARRADVRLETACHFVNACWALGLLGDPSRIASASVAAVDDEPRTLARSDDGGDAAAPSRKPDPTGQMRHRVADRSNVVLAEAVT